MCICAGPCVYVFSIRRLHGATTNNTRYELMKARAHVEHTHTHTLLYKTLGHTAK